MVLEDVITGEYVIEDGIVNVNGSVGLAHNKLKRIPWKFGTVTGDFYCYSNELISLENAPHTVGVSFNCYNNRLASLKYSPRSVGLNFDCSDNYLTSLRYLPRSVGGVIFCAGNHIKTLMNVSLDNLIKINNIQTDYQSLFLPIPIEFKSSVKNLMAQKKQIKTISYKKRLNSI